MKAARILLIGLGLGLAALGYLKTYQRVRQAGDPAAAAAAEYSAKNSLNPKKLLSP